jgi:cytochrome b6-f complex subunit 4
MTQLDRPSSAKTDLPLTPELTLPKRTGRRRWAWLNNFLYLFPTVGLGTIGLCIGLAVLNPIAMPDPADPFATPEHLLPEWYLLPIYQLVRLIPYKIVGIVTMVTFATGLLILPIIENLVRFDPRLRRGVSIAIFSFSTIVTLWLGFGARLPIEDAFSLGLF